MVAWVSRMGRVLAGLVAIAVVGAMAVPAAEPAEPVADAKGMVTVYPVESDAYLLNPGKGWIIYTNFAKASDEAWAKASVGYSRYTWDRIHTGDNTFDWSWIDRHLAECVERGKQFAFGIMPVSVIGATNSVGMPQWVIDAGAAWTPAKKVSTVKVPVWEDPVFIAKMGQLVTAMAERYNGNPNIAFIDCRTYGNWGEWHLGGLGGKQASPALKQTFIDQWKGFDKTWIIAVNSGGKDTRPGGVGLYARDKYGFGGREDSSEHTPRWATCLPFLGVGPVIGEWSHPYNKLKVGDTWTRIPWRDEMLGGQILGSAYSYQPLGEWNGTVEDANQFLAEKPALVDEWQNKMGYWFRVTEAAFPSDLANGTTGTLVLNVRNDGVAPIYVKGKLGVVKAALLDADGKVLSTVTLKDVNPFDWAPGKTTTAKAELAFAAQPTATKLAIGVFTAESLEAPNVKLGIDGGTDANWYVLSDMPTAPPAK